MVARAPLGCVKGQISGGGTGQVPRLRVATPARHLHGFGVTDLNKVIVLQSDTMVFGILADTILGVCRVPVSEIQPSLPTLTGIREKYLKGVTRERTVLLDAEKLLADEKIIVQEQV